MAIADVTHTIIAGKARREGSAALNIPGTGTQFLDSRIVERSLSVISGQLEDQFDRSDQHVLIDNTGVPVVIQDTPIDVINYDSVGNEGSYLIDGEDGSRKARLDTTTHAQNIIDYAHHEVHAGSHYNFSTGIVDLDDGASKDYILTVPNNQKWPHMLFNIEGALFTRIQAFEDTTHATGVAHRISNNNRNSLNIAGLKISDSSGNASNGTEIFHTSFGISTGPGGKIAGGGGARGDAEWILKQDTKYLLKITSLTDDNNISCVLEWYEHTDKT